MGIGRTAGAQSAHNIALQKGGAGDAYELSDCCMQLLDIKAGDGATIMQHIGGAKTGERKVSINWQAGEKNHDVFMKQTVENSTLKLWGLVLGHQGAHAKADGTDAQIFWKGLVERKKKLGTTANAPAPAGSPAPVNKDVLAYRGHSEFVRGK